MIYRHPQSRRIAFLLPTMATSDRMYARVSGFVARQLAGGASKGASVSLTHSVAWLSSAYGAVDADPGAQVLSCEDQAQGAGDRDGAGLVPKRWLRGGKRPLLAQFAVGTIDQAPRSAFVQSQSDAWPREAPVPQGRRPWILCVEAADEGGLFVQ